MTLEPKHRAVSVRAPLRIDWAGMTDYRPFCRDFGGKVLNASISSYVHVDLAVRDDDRVSVRAPDIGLERAVDHYRDVATLTELPILAAVSERLAPRFGYDLVSYLDMPRGAGLGSSSAYAIATIAAFNGLCGHPMDLHTVADLAIDCEFSGLGAYYGWQDQCSPILPPGIKFLSSGPSTRERNFRAEILAVGDGVLDQIEKRTVLAFSGVSRAAVRILSAVAEGVRAGNQGVVGALEGITACADRMRVALLEGDLESFGREIDRVLDHHKALHPEVYTARVHEVLTTARAQGALAGKMCGAGGGGTLLLWAADGEEYRLREAMREIGCVVFPVNLRDARLSVRVT
jgi:D-glycero-alpha-D-manno-heptose-7-phosphate kinase